MGSITVRRLGYALGAEISGLDLSTPPDAEVIAEIRRASLEHIVLCFPRQDLDEERMAAFCRQFGPLEERAFADNQPAHPAVHELTNKPRVLYGKPGGYSIADLWHSDQDYTDRPSTLNFLWAKTLPPIGGDTMFANMYLAYETLSPGMRDLIDPLEALHDHTLSLAYTKSPAELQAEIKRRFPPVAHPVARVHPETNRRALYLGERIRSIVGMTEEESKPLVGFLNEHSVRYEFIYRHRWSVGIWWSGIIVVRCTTRFPTTT